MNTNPTSDDMAEEYDFSVGERGRLAKRLEGGYDVVIDDDEAHATHVPTAQVRAVQARQDDGRERALRKRA